MIIVIFIEFCESKLKNMLNFKGIKRKFENCEWRLICN